MKAPVTDEPCRELTQAFMHRWGGWVSEDQGQSLQVGGKVRGTRQKLVFICAPSVVFIPVLLFLASPESQSHSQMKPFSPSCPRPLLSPHGRPDSLRGHLLSVLSLVSVFLGFFCLLYSLNPFDEINEMNLGPISAALLHRDRWEDIRSQLLMSR